LSKDIFDYDFEGTQPATNPLGGGDVKQRHHNSESHPKQKLVLKQHTKQL